jgi:hypothetical protein
MRTIKAHTEEVAHALGSEGFYVRIKDGSQGEFSVWMGDRELARNLCELPSPETILASVHHAEVAVVS